MRPSNEPISRPVFGRSRLNRKQTHGLLEHFVAGTPARTAADLIGIHRNSATLFFHRLRQVITARLAQSNGSNPESAREIEIGVHVFGRAGVLRPVHNASGKATVMGLLQRGGRIQAVVLRDGGRDTLLSILRDRLDAGAVVYADRPDIDEALNALGICHYGIDRGARGPAARAHISGLENFWSQTERSLRQYNGIPAHRFALFLKECEWRFNCRSPKQRLATLAEWIDLSR